MTAVFMRRTLRGLEPVDEDGTDSLRRIKVGSDVLVEVRRPRNIRALRLYWGLVTLVWQNLPEDKAEAYPSKETLSDALKVCVGHCETIQLPNGTVFRRPKSVGFSAVEEGEFQEFLDRCIGIVVRHFLPGVRDTDLRREIEEMCGLRRHAA